MTKTAIQKTLTQACIEWATDQGISFVVSNQDYEPIVGQSYARQWFMDNTPVDTVLAEGHERLIGMMQIDLNVPYGQGEAEILDLYESFKLIFKTNGRIRNKQGMVQLAKVYLQGSNAESPWYTRYITVEYSAFSDN
jgi:hypothetical protein